MLALAADTPWDYDRAPAGIRRAGLGRFYFYRSVVAVIDAELGMARQAAEAGARFATIHPKFLADVAAELIKRNCRPEDRVHLMASLARGRLGRPGKLHRVEGTRLSRRPVRQRRQAAPDLVLEMWAMVCTRLSNVAYCKLHDLRPGIASLRHCGVATTGGGDQGGGQVCLPPQLRQGIGTRPGSTSPPCPDNEPSFPQQYDPRARNRAHPFALEASEVSEPNSTPVLCRLREQPCRTSE